MRCLFSDVVTVTDVGFCRQQVELLPLITH